MAGAHRLGQPVEMRAHVTALAAAGVMFLALAIMNTGSNLSVPSPDMSPADVADIETAVTPDAPDQNDSAEKVAAPEPVSPGRSAPLQRVAPRPPLSELSTPQSPAALRPTKQEAPKYVRLFNPAVSRVGMIEAQGYAIKLDGVEPLTESASCTHDGRSWPCGAFARTAFRQWLRARAVQCKVPTVANPVRITTDCHIGQQDIALFLVQSGWLHASPSGPYADSGRQAQADGKGIFGRPPDYLTTAPVSGGDPTSGIGTRDTATSTGGASATTMPPASRPAPAR